MKTNTWQRYNCLAVRNGILVVHVQVEKDAKGSAVAELDISNFCKTLEQTLEKELTYHNRDRSWWWTRIEIEGKTKVGKVVNGSEVLWSRRAKFAKWKFLQLYTVSVKLLPLRRDACICHSPCGAHVFARQEGSAVGSGSDLGGDDLSVSWLCLLPSLDSVFLDLIFLFTYNILPFPSCFSLARSSLLYLLLTLPFFVLVTMATAFFESGREARGLMEDTGAYDTLAIHHCPSLSLLLNLYLFQVFN